MYLHYKQFFTNKFIDDLIEKNLAIDGTNGGLLLGPSHDHGGIKVIERYSYGYILVAEYEGFEYMFNPGASDLYDHYYELYNDYEGDKTEFFEEYVPNDKIRVIDTSLKNNKILSSKLLILDARGRYILFNKHSSKIHLETLNDANLKSTYQFLVPLLNYKKVGKKEQNSSKIEFIKRIFRKIRNY